MESQRQLQSDDSEALDGYLTVTQREKKYGKKLDSINDTCYNILRVLKKYKRGGY